MHAAPDPVLLLHGQPGGAGDWDRVRAAVGSRAATIAIDRPGWDRRREAANLSGNAAAALAALDAHGIARATVAGHSFGAGVAAWMAAWHPERVSSLILIAPAANVASLYRLDYWMAAPVAGYLASVATLAGLGAALRASPVRRWVAGQLALDDRYLRGAAGLLLDPHAWRANSIEQRALVTDLPKLEQRLGSITAATTIVVGTEDHVVPRSSARQLARQIRGATLIELEHAGHMLLQQQAERLADVIVPPGPQASSG